MATLKPKIESVEAPENIYYAIFENSMDAILITVPDGRILSANRAACRMFELTEEEICDLGMSGIIDSSDPRFGKAILDREQTGLFSGELSGLRRDKSIFPIFVTFSVFTDSQGEPRSGMMIRDITEHKIEVEKDVNGNVFRHYRTVQDINERKRVEEALQKSDLLLRTILNNAPITIFATDRQGVFTLSDGNELKSVGFKPGENVGISAFDLYNLLPFAEWPDKKLTGKNVLNRALAGENITVTNELNGVWFENHIGPILNEDGKVMGIVGVATNITERKLAEYNFLEVEGRYRLLSEQSGIGIGLYSPGGEILYFNNQALSTLGGKTKKYTGKLLTEVFGEQKGTEYLKRIRKAIRTGKSYNYEDFVQTPSGSYWFLSNHMRVCNSKGKVIGVQVLAHDITERKRTEEKLEQSTEEYRTLVQHIEEEMENERTQIARDLHDNLGQKLTALNMDISWLKSRIGVQSRSVVNKLNEMVHLLTESMESIKKISFGLRPSILDDLGIREAIEWQLKDFYKSTRIKYSFFWGSGEMNINKKISTTVFRIIQEALTNVVRHSGATEVSLNFIFGKNKLKLIFTDNGRGIEEDQILNLKSFGLIGMKERAKSCGGDLIIKGMKGKGTKLVVTIPINREK